MKTTLKQHWSALDLVTKPIALLLGFEIAHKVKYDIAQFLCFVFIGLFKLYKLEFKNRLPIPEFSVYYCMKAMYHNIFKSLLLKKKDEIQGSFRALSLLEGILLLWLISKNRKVYSLV